MHIIIQARYNAVRLPGKVMLRINGKPMLWHVIERAKAVGLPVIVATPDEEIVSYALKQGVDTYLGSEDDVLDRYYQAAKEYRVTDIVRLTADNPLIDPVIVNKVICLYLAYSEGYYDYASNNLKRTYPIGLDVEVFSFKALEKAWVESKEPMEREHVTPYIRNHPEMFKLGNVENDKDLSYLRWTVDTPEDLEFARNVYRVMKGKPFGMEDILREYYAE